jgi:hypothetical protein
MEKTITYSTNEELSFVWHGSHTVNIFLAGQEVDCFTLYPEGGRVPTADEVEAACDERLSDYAFTEV